LILTHYVPALAPGDEDTWRAQAAEHFDGAIEVGDDLHTVTI
jgi:ribonuclease Z